MTSRSSFEVTLRCYTHKADVMHTFGILEYPTSGRRGIRDDAHRADFARRWWSHFGPITPLADGDEIKAVAS